MSNNTTSETSERTFTQDEVNHIVSERLAKEKAKADPDLVKREQELQRREMAVRAKEVLAERGLPKDLASVLRYSDEESLVMAVDHICKLKGFKEEKPDKNKRVVIENRLPDGIGSRQLSDPLRKAFNLTGEE